ncbi:Mobile element protein [Candidatus Enterovibrio escicola]|uniref:Mobile element protein n=1 Tax=Candidatus Enterovibrio escicola TaxID=1927127 RepID=A0A2A5T6L8_9GAMM|nr:Mobile element protein [Candidatus Enterovibrio escacola]
MIESLYQKWLTSFGGLYGDKGYISGPLERELADKGVTLITGIKNISQIEHSRHRSCISFMVNLLAGLSAYSFQPKKPSFKRIRFDKQALMQI